MLRSVHPLSLGLPTDKTRVYTVVAPLPLNTYIIHLYDLYLTLSNHLFKYIKIALLDVIETCGTCGEVTTAFTFRSVKARVAPHDEICLSASQVDCFM